MTGLRPRRGLGRVAGLGLVVAVAIGCGGPVTRSSAGPSPGSGIVAEIASYQVVARQPGRLLVALFAADNRWLSFGSIAVRFTFLGDAQGSPAPVAASGPASGSFLPIPGSPDGAGRGPTLTLPADGRGVYAVEPVTFQTSGYWQVDVHAELADGSIADGQAAFAVLDRPTVPTVGSAAPHTDNPVIGDPGVTSSALDSRARGGQPIPDPELHSTSIADALAAHRPALVVFSTPVYCVSRFCGPVTDLVSALAADYADRAAFIHVEIYRDFEAGAVNQAALDWLAPASGDLREPWTFLIGADGRIAGSWDAVVTRAEIEPLLEALPAIP
jgi:hypothetical protein